MSIAYAHGGETHATEVLNPAIFWAWSFDWVFLIPLLLGVFYFKGYFTYRLRGGRKFPVWRPILFAIGLLLAALALMGPIDALAGSSFIWHMAQHDLLTLLAVPVLLLGAPFIPVVRGLPGPLRRGLFIPLARNRIVRWLVWRLTHPLVALLAFELTLLVWHFPAIYDRALFNEGMHILMHGSLAFTAVLFWWNLVNPHPFPWRLHHLLRMLMLFASSVVNTLLSSIITFSPQVLYGYESQTGFLGMSMAEDQFVGGSLMWVMGAMLRLGALTLIFFDYARMENAKEPALAARRTTGLPA